MRCAACGADHPAEAKRCPACGERTNRKPRRREPVEEIDSPFGRRTDSRQATALRAYRCAVFSLIPLAGLLLGPAAVVLAVIAWREGLRDPAAKANGYVVAALLLGLAALLCNAAGVVLMVMGLTGGP
jgi:hypothetical protein